MPDISESIRQALHLLQQSQNAVAITGAGISTPSGIPDFRSANSGLWENVDPNVATLSFFRRHPERFFKWARPLVETILRASPNAAHRALAELEQLGPLQAIITQNIDMLHEDAGSKVVYEVHGHMREATCLSCRRTEPGRQHIREFIATGRLPQCTICGNILKPNVILFGEMLPWHTYRRAEQAVHDADLILVAGSSLEVAPVNELPLHAKRTGAAIIIVNREPTIMDHLADLLIHHDVTDILPRLAEEYRSRHP